MTTGDTSQPPQPSLADALKDGLQRAKMTTGDTSQNEPADSEAWAAALAGAMQAQRDFRAENGNPEWDSDWDDEVEAILEAAWPHIAAQARQEEVRERVAEQRAVHEDLALLLRVLGLGDHARPQSSHEVMLDAINEVGRLRARVEFGERTEAQIRAAQQEADARLAEQRRATYPVVTTDAICLEGETRTQVKREPFADLLRQDGGSPC